MRTNILIQLVPPGECNGSANPPPPPLPDRRVYSKLPPRVQHPKHVQQAVRQPVASGRGQRGIPQRLSKCGRHVIARWHPEREHRVHGDQADPLVGN